LDWCFDGLPKDGVVSVSTVGVMRSADALMVWRRGMDRAMQQLKPKGIVLYGSQIDYDFGKAQVYYYKNKVFRR